MINPVLEAGWLQAILPEIILSAGGMILILVGVFMPRGKVLLAPLALAALIAAAWSHNFVPEGMFFGGTYEISAMTRIFDLAFLLATILCVLFSREYLHREQIESGEYYALLLWGTFGMMLMSKGLDLLIVVLGLEILSVCIFVLLGAHRRLSISNEASLKYFLMGAFATGFILYGTALLYGASGSTNVRALATFFSTSDGKNPLLSVAFVMLMSGFGFKLALAPFHAWAPDVYQGGPTPVSGWLSAAPKAATLIALMRIFHAMAPVLPKVAWMEMLAVLAVLSMVVGNLVAIVQRDLKRMLAYSGIAHVGYMTLALLSVTRESVAAISVYVITYALMNIGAFGVVSMIAKNQNDPQTLDDISGLGFRRPLLGLALAVCMFSLSGLPPTGGFISKFYIFRSAIQAGHTGLAVIGIITSIFSVYYYLRVVYYLYMKDSADAAPMATPGAFALSGMAISLIGIMLIGVFPGPIFQMAGAAARALLLQ